MQGKKRRVKDLMLPLRDYATIVAHGTLGEALAALGKAQLGLTQDRHHHRAILVLDDNGEVIGKLSHWSILRRLEAKIFTSRDTFALAATGFSPEFIAKLEEGLTLHFENLEALCKAAAKMNVRAAMVPVGESIDEDASLIEAIHKLVKTHAQSLPVSRASKTVGILRLSDVFDVVTEMIRDYQ